MKKFLNNLEIVLSGESHSSKISAKFSGIESGYNIDNSKIEDILIKRNPNTFYNTPRKDSNKVYFISGIKDSQTNGEIIEFYLENDNVKSKDYTKFEFRLGHADYVSFKKFGENYPYAGGGPFSGRITALIVVIGEIVRQILEQKDKSFKINSQVKRMLDFEADSIIYKSLQELDSARKDILKTQDIGEDFLCFNKDDQDKVNNILKAIKSEGDSVGAELEFRVSGIDDNFGSIYLQSFESTLSAAIFSIPGIKGIKFGSGDDFFLKKGSELKEKVKIVDNKIIPLTNINGGINGGILNGYQDIYFTTIVKPPMSISKDMDILKYSEGNYEVINRGIVGRHDSFIGNKVFYVVNAWIYIIILDYILDK